jgi:hypothetical protein
LKQKAFLGSFVYALKQSRQFDLSALSTISLETVLVPPGSIMIASALVLVVAAFVRLAMTFGIMAVMAARSI